MKTGIGTAYYSVVYGEENAFKKMKEHGFDCADFQHILSNTNNPVFQSQSPEFERKLLEIKKRADDAGIEIYQAHGPWEWPVRDGTPEKRALLFEDSVKSLYACSVIGCKNLVLHPITPFGFEKRPNDDELYDINVEYFSKLLEKAKEYDTVICFENMPWRDVRISFVDKCLEIAKLMNDEHFKLCLDTGHCSAVGGNSAEAVRLFGKKYLAALHVHDNDGKGDAHWLPYEGVNDWKDFSNALHEIGFEGPVSIETSVRGKLPPELREYFEIGLAKIARSLA